VRVIYGLAFTMFQTVFAIFAQNRLGLEAQTTGYVLTYVGVLIVAIQGGGIGWLSRRYRDKQLVFSGTILLCFSLLAWALVPTVWILLIVLAPLALAGSVLNVASNSALTKCVLGEEAGGILGLSASFDSLTRVASPIIGGLLLDNVGTAAPGIAGALVTAWLIYYIWRKVLFVPDLVCPEPELSG
jgi:DHA1 family tetracycline resistance protein-like MFS transporter